MGYYFSRMERQELRLAIQTLLNDVMEQCFRELIHYPQESTAMNEIIRECASEASYLTIKVDAHGFEQGSEDLRGHYREVSRDLHRKSLELMGQLQRARQHHRISAAGE